MANCCQTVRGNKTNKDQNEKKMKNEKRVGVKHQITYLLIYLMKVRSEITVMADWA